MDTSGLTLRSDRLDIPDGAEEILDVLGAVLSKPYVQSISVKSGGGISVSWYAAPGDSLISPDLDDSVDTVISRVELLDDYMDETPSTPSEAMLWVLLEIDLDGEVPTHIMCKSVSVLKKWLGISKSVRLRKDQISGRTRIFGIEVVETDSFPVETGVVLSSRVRGKGLSGINKGYKFYMGE